MSRLVPDGGLVRSAVALCLPTVAVVALGVYFLVDKVPAIERAERARVRSAYREAARAIRAQPQKYAPLPGGVPKEWRRTAAKMAPGRWGWFVEGGADTARVWYEGEDAARCDVVPVVPETDYRTMLVSAVSLFLLVLVAITAVGVRYFVEYVKTRDDFLAATAHDLTTPLVGMRYAIGRRDDDAKVLNERMLRLVQNIKDFLRLGARRPRPARERVDLLACFDEAYRLFREDFRELFGGADIPVEAGDGPSRTALGDETLVVQILWNVLGNDLKYAAPDGPVRVRISSEGAFARVEVADEGKGMSPAEMRRAFDRYYRARTVLASGKGGFGIGLCAARELAESMGGSLTVRANEPRGCVFTLALPRGGADAKGAGA